MIDIKNTFKIEIDCKRFLQNSSKDQNKQNQTTLDSS